MASQNMASISVKTGNWTLRRAKELYIKSAMLCKDYELFLSK